MKTFAQIQQETQDIQFDFLMSDLDTAFTFLDIAQTTQNSETRARNLKHANVACAAVEGFSSRVKMTEQQCGQLDEKLHRLQERIRSCNDPGEAKSEAEG